MKKKITSIKYSKEKRAHIPGMEEAGYEDANEKVAEGIKELALPKNPVVHRGQDPELSWLNKYGNDDRDNLLKVDIRSLYRHIFIFQVSNTNIICKIKLKGANPRSGAFKFAVILYVLPHKIMLFYNFAVINFKNTYF